jgi:exopolysaccharide biosynthesis polyprenyl glycosylphosphotransferase
VRSEIAETIQTIQTTPAQETPRRSVRSGRRLVLNSTIASMDAMAVLAALALHWTGQIVCLLLGAMIFCLLACSGSQRSPINPRLEREIPALLAWTGIPFAIVAGLFASRPDEVGPAAKVAATAIVLVVAGRGLSYGIIRSARRRAWAPEPTLIVGAGEVGAMVATALQEHRQYGLVPVGFLDSFDGVGLSMPVLGDAHALLPIAQHNSVTKVIIAFGAMAESDMVEILRTCDRLPIEVYVVPRFFELGVTTGGNRYDDVWGIPLLRLRRSALRTMARWSKRLFDLVVATVVLLLTSPLCLAAALAVRLSSPGPILLGQRRVGQDGREFELLKFRSMVMNGDADTAWSAADDYMTPVGRLLRRTSVDELPQLLNVLRGDMSLVGPRPERPYFVTQFSAEVRRYNDRHRVPAGITGWAQVHGLKGDTPIPDRVRFDNYYIEHWSLWRDVVIVAQTIGKLLTLR